MSTNVYASGNDLPAPRVYLKINHKRHRDGFVEEAPANQYVRVQWDTTEMGALPAPLERALATRTKFLFRRLPAPPTATLKPRVAVFHDAQPLTNDVAKPAVAATSSTQPPPARAHVERVTQAGKCVLIECEQTTEGAATALYVLDTHASEREAMEDAFGEFAITDDGAATLDESGVGKRRRDAQDDVLDIFLAPVRRCTFEQDHTAALQDAPVCTSRWGPVEEDVTGTTWEMLLTYDEVLCLEGSGEAAADLYCYPDHRKDDEYDSNAEDFSGNDYPDDADDGVGDGASVHDSSEVEGASAASRSRHGHGYSAYGVFYEEGYSERSLSDGWGSEDD
jgi:hypothetical protein